MGESCRNMIPPDPVSPLFSQALASLSAAQGKTRPDYDLERERMARGAPLVAGIDEAGRGPLAGPVVTAAVILDETAIPDGLDDSKKMSVRERERLFPEILRWAHVSIAFASAAEIDRLNIRQATLLAMTRAFDGLAVTPGHTLIDGRDVPHPLQTKATAVIGGDGRSLSIAAASIVAKVVRDRLMTRLCACFPEYGFSRHMGYGTKAHLAAIEQKGPCPHHRMSFRPLRVDSPALI